jgi:ABC-type transport system involved in cytochrome c biogenesis ATPase subunit
MRRRLGLARLLLRPPRLLLLDEPYASFDQDGIDVVNEFDRGGRGGGVVILTTHDMARGGTSCRGVSTSPTAAGEGACTRTVGRAAAGVGRASQGGLA